MSYNNHLFRKIQAIQNKAAQRRNSRLNDSRDAVYNEQTNSKMSLQFTPEQVASTKRKVIANALKDQRDNKRFWYYKLVLTIILIIIIFWWLFL
ncbi:hypothetical protein FNJ87_05780 [Nonlabens mediterrranea]|uniref:Riboflavin synthase subunit beta n=1 Tax=Nonlabens mediterrranea TaxID=1419947 RepID=A0ABS0A3D3_9FLAO|nr:hypothetical protein [Nonlabens mediterrranea]